MSKLSSAIVENLPHTIKLPDGRTVFVEVPAEMVRRDRGGEIGFTVAGIKFLDRIRALAMEMGDHPTPGHILALREALDLTQVKLAAEVGVDPLTVSRWERGEMSPGTEALAQLQRLRRRAAARGTAISHQTHSRGPRSEKKG
jgi:DNA-binding transcriptional regulator YiaG